MLEVKDEIKQFEILEDQLRDLWPVSKKGENFPEKKLKIVDKDGNELKISILAIKPSNRVRRHIIDNNLFEKILKKYEETEKNVKAISILNRIRNTSNINLRGEEIEKLIRNRLLFDHIVRIKMTPNTNEYLRNYYIQKIEPLRKKLCSGIFLSKKELSILDYAEKTFCNLPYETREKLKDIEQTLLTTKRQYRNMRANNYSLSLQEQFDELSLKLENQLKPTVKARLEKELQRVASKLSAISH